ncbi:hypothetical protein [Mucisphaera sp.]|uniref:hypothetical protein n=1 Tax=Mucisphaera sp. TaxID=2913024 RepID=UPI003D144A81
MRAILLALVIATTGLTVGCGGPKTLEAPVTSADIRRNISPTLDSTATTDEQDFNNIVRTMDMDIRMLRDDFLRAFMLTNPSGLTGTPVY